jgi:hypothetical protein
METESPQPSDDVDQSMRLGEMKASRQRFSAKTKRRIGAGAVLLGTAIILAVVTPRFSHHNASLVIARRMLEGKLHLAEKVSWFETFERDARYYAAYPPMTSVVLLPAVLIGGERVTQPLINTLLIIASAWLCYAIVGALPRIRRAAWLAAIVFVFGTSNLYSATIGNCWLLMHSQGNFFLLLAIYFVICRGSYVWAGLAFMTAAQCRHSLLAAGVAFVLLAFWPVGRGRTKSPPWARIGRFALGAIPPAIVAVALQWAMTGSPFLSPYSVALHQWKPDREPLFGPQYVVQNLKFYLYSPPEFLPQFPYIRFWHSGQSVWMMTPVLLGMLAASWRDRANRALLCGAAAGFGFYLFYHWNGHAQYGSRYMQDLYPLLLIPSFSGFRPRRGWGWELLNGFSAASILINVYGAWVMARFPL